ncbi:hypothetical protein HHI36_016261 [Cryptolaemus montrouzieri]|uniref:Mediator of RNA polymerase II transcription subunit 28 n=1 Tax=Cryptolaemus montrouzieri TaxID=559131 RepID=A0ABD2NIZ3_9CUCU
MSVAEKDEIKVEVEHTTFRFIDLARQMEAFFLQKRFLLSALKPEMVIKEDINELRLELARKEEVLKKHSEKITVWQNILSDLKSSNKGSVKPNGGTSGNAGNISPSGEIPGNINPSPMLGLGVAPGMQQLQQDQFHQQLQQQRLQQMQHLQLQPQMQVSLGLQSEVNQGMVPHEIILMEQSGLQSLVSLFPNRELEEQCKVH